jgi:hypothetical protein
LRREASGQWERGRRVPAVGRAPGDGKQRGGRQRVNRTVDALPEEPLRLADSLLEVLRRDLLDEEARGAARSKG